MALRFREGIDFSEHLYFVTTQGNHKGLPLHANIVVGARRFGCPFILVFEINLKAE